jgi:hypothetical protein
MTMFGFWLRFPLTSKNALSIKITFPRLCDKGRPQTIDLIAIDALRS